MDEWLRERLTPSPAQVRRVLRHAIEEGDATARSPNPHWRLVAAAAATAILALAFVAVTLRQRTPGDSRVRVRYGANVATATITNQSGEVELLLPPGWKHPGSARQVARPSRPETVKLFNSDGCTAVALPEGNVRYYIVGGDT